MTRPESIDTLNRLLQILGRSLAVYLQQARPWGRLNSEKARQVLADLASDQHRLAERIAEAVTRRGGRIESGGFPAQFTAMHDLALDFLLAKTVQQHRRDVEAIEHCVGQLAEDPQFRSLAEEVRDNQRGHLQALESLLADDEFREK